MNKTILNYVIDLVSLLVMLALAATGLITRFVLPPGSGGHGGGAHSSLWGWTRHDWGDLHAWLAAAIAGLLLLHVALHWNWVCCVTQKMLSRGSSEQGSPWVRNLSGLGTLAAVTCLLLGFLWLSSTQVVNTQSDRGPAHTDSAGHIRLQSDNAASNPAGGAGLQEPADDHHALQESIQGSMTLAEIATATGVPAEQIRSDLKLPESASLNERVGRLRRQFGFEMEDLRQLVQARQNHENARR